MPLAAILRFRKLKDLPLDPPSPENPTTELDIMSLSYVEPEPVLCQFEFLNKMAAGHLGFDQPEVAPLNPPTTKTLP